MAGVAGSRSGRGRKVKSELHDAGRVVRFSFTHSPEPTTGDPSFPRVTDGLNGPISSRLHHAPVFLFVARSVNQYCHSSVLTMSGGLPLNGSSRNKPSTLGLPSISRSSVSTTQGFSSHGTSEANHRFQSKRG